MKKILFRTHGDRKTGLGHLMRCISLAHAFCETGPVAIIFLVNREAVPFVQQARFLTKTAESFGKEDMFQIFLKKPDLILVDSYTTDDTYLEETGKIAKTAIFDDNNDIYRHPDVDAVINGNIHAKSLRYSVPANRRTLFFTGPEYLVMKPEYWDKQEYTGKREGILMTTGGSDPCNVMPNLVKTLSALKIKKRVVIGPMYSRSQRDDIRRNADDTVEILSKPGSLKSPIGQSVLVITASGSTVYEVLTMKRRPLIFQVGEDQRLLAAELERLGVQSIGSYPDISWDALPAIVEKMLSKCPAITGLWNLFDGQGARRTARGLMELIGND